MQDDASESLYCRLRRHLDRMPVGLPETKSGVEIRILKRLFTPEEARIVLELSAIPEPVATIHKRFGSRMTPPALEEALDRMAEKEIVLAFSVDGKVRYGKLVYAIGMYERQLKRLTPEFERDHQQYTEEAFSKAFHSKKTTQLRVVPVNKQIAVERGVSTYDQIRAHIETSPGPFGVLNCICRHGKDLLGERCKQTELRENCLMIGPAAQSAVDSGRGRAVTRQELLDLLDQADKEGLVLETENTKEPMFVCCCCGCCCGVLTSAKRFAAPAEYFSSNFHAAVTATVCEGCGTCLTRCQMDAITIPEGTAVVDLARCIGCGLCVTECPSVALHLVSREHEKVPPDNTRDLYVKMYRERFGAWGMAKLGARKMLGMKI